MNQGNSTLPPRSTVADLGKFDVQEVIGVLRGAPQTLHINDANTTYLIIDAAKDGSLNLYIHASDGTNSGYIEVAADGTVQQIYGPGS